jgi:hypothetical protein
VRRGALRCLEFHARETARDGAVRHLTTGNRVPKGSLPRCRSFVENMWIEDR